MWATRLCVLAACAAVARSTGDGIHSMLNQLGKKRLRMARKEKQGLNRGIKSYRAGLDIKMTIKNIRWKWAGHIMRISKNKSKTTEIVGQHRYPEVKADRKRSGEIKTELSLEQNEHINIRGEQFKTSGEDFVLQWVNND